MSTLSGGLMNAIEHALNRLKFSDIPSRILEDGFKTKETRYGRRRKSIDAEIRDKIIDELIKPDLESIGGVMIQVELSGLPYDKLEDYSRIYTIPHNRTLGREIVMASRVALNVTSNYAERVPGQSTQAFTVSPFERSIQSVISSHRPIPNITNAEVEILGNNVVKINDYQNFSVDITLECRVGYSPDMIEIKKPYYQDFAELLNVATKAYLYRELSIDIDRARLEGGRELGRYKDFVDQWSEHYQMYQDLLDSKWHKILLLNDQARKQKHIMRSGKFKI